MIPQTTPLRWRPEIFFFFAPGHPLVNNGRTYPADWVDEYLPLLFRGFGPNFRSQPLFPPLISDPPDPPGTGSGSPLGLPFLVSPIASGRVLHSRREKSDRVSCKVTPFCRVASPVHPSFLFVTNVPSFLTHVHSGVGLFPCRGSRSFPSPCSRFLGPFLPGRRSILYERHATCA